VDGAFLKLSDYQNRVELGVERQNLLNAVSLKS
jgi:hypothetical protein